MNDELKNIVQNSSDLIEKIKNAINRKLDFKEAGMVEVATYQHTLLELQKEAKELTGEELFAKIAATRTEYENDDDYSEGMFKYANNSRYLTCELMDALNEEISESDKFIRMNNDLSRKLDEFIAEKNSDIASINSTIAEKNTKLKEVKEQLANNRNPSLVDALNRSISELTSEIAELTGKVSSLEGDIEEYKKNKQEIISGTKVPTPDFTERAPAENMPVTLDSNNEIAKKIEKAKELVTKAKEIIAKEIDYEEAGLVGTAVYESEMKEIQKQIKEITGENIFEQLASSRAKMNDDEFAVAMYEYAVLNRDLSQGIMDDLNTNIIESDKYFRNRTEEYNAIRDRKNQYDKDIAKLEFEIKDYKNRIDQAEKNRRENRNPYLNDVYDKKIIELNKELVDRINSLDDLKNLSKADEIYLNEILNGNKNKSKNKEKDKEKDSGHGVNPNRIPISPVPPAIRNGRIVRPAPVKPPVPPIDPRNPEDIDKNSADIVEGDNPVIPKVKGNKPKLTWKTAIAVAAGIGIGATVFFTTGPLGVGIMSTAGAIAKKFINKQRKKLAELNKVGSPVTVESVEEPKTGIQAAIDKVKKYLNSEEGLRDISWLINSAIITGMSLTVGTAIKNLVEAKAAAAAQSNIPTQPETVPDIDPSITQTATTPTAPDPASTISYDDIVLGDKVGSFNVSTGHVNAANAVSGSNAKTLLSQYVNGDSIFNRFAAINPDGSLGPIINTDGLSITEFCAQNNLDVSQIAIDVARKDGASQAWISVEELMKGVGGPKI